MGKLTICLLGPFRVEIDGRAVSAFESDKGRALLAYLAVESHQAHTRERLAEMLWPDHPEGRARHSLNQAVYNLRRSLGERPGSQPPLFLITPDTIRLNPESVCWLDAAEFARLIEACKWHAHHSPESCEQCCDRFQQAISLYQGDFLTDLSLRDSTAFDEWCLSCRERYLELARYALTSLAGSYEGRGQINQAVEFTQRLAALNPLDEDACQRLMRLLAASGKRSQALSCYEGFRRRLQEELGVPPDMETHALYERIRLEKHQQAHASPRRDNLPASLSPLIGRESELAELQNRLLDPACRLLTVLGPGGAGKSRLALEAARGLRERFTDGVYLVSISPLTSAEAILPSLEKAIGLPVNPQKPLLAQVQAHLRYKELLLVLDGCEGLLEGIPTVAEILRAGPQLKILATSRTRLNMEGEQVYLLGGLECPSADDPQAAISSASVRLFASGARRVRPGFDIDPSSLPAVVELCNEVQGMPLAILLAAAWAEVFSPAEILAEMRSSLDFLQAEWADLPARQRSVRTTFDYSWSLLDKSEQAIFQALCVFRGGFTRQAAKEVGGADPRQLRRLVDKSFLAVQAGEWYAIHDLLRQFGLEKLNEQPATSQEVYRSYSAYYLEKLSEWEAGLKGDRLMETLSLLDTKINDLRPAWEWAAEHHVIDSLERGLETLCLYYELRARFTEGRSLCQETSNKLAEGELPQTARLLAHLAVWESRFERLLGEQAQARQRREESQALLGDLQESDPQGRRIQAMVYLESGEAVFTADLAEAQRCLEHSLALYRQLGDSWRTAGVLHRLGINRHHAGDFAGSDRLFGEAIDLFQEIGSTPGVANAQRMKAQTLMRIGQTGSALALMHQVIQSSQASGDRAQTMQDLRALGLALGWNGSINEEVYQLLDQALSIAQELGSRYDIAFTHVILGFFGYMSAQYELARRHVTAGLELARRDGFQREIAACLFILGCVDLAERSPQSALPFYQESISQYRQIGHPDELGWALSMGAFCLLSQGAVDRARPELAEALKIAHSLRAYLSALHALAVSACWLGSQWQAASAQEIYTLLTRQPLFANSPWFQDVLGKAILAQTAGLEAQSAAAAQERGQQRDLWASLAEMLELIQGDQYQ